MTRSPLFAAVSACALLALVAGAPLSAQLGARPDPDAADDQSVAPASRAFFYKGLPGSDLYVGPFDVILNKGFNMAQTVNRDPYIFEAPYGHEHLRGSVLHPLRSIRESGGWGEFVTEQILPVQAVNWARSGFDWGAADNMTWYPNYFGHLIEGGITSRRLAEKLRAQGVPAAAVVAGATTMAAAAMNEMYTHPEITDGTAGTVADLYVFDFGGVLLFSFDPVARLFADKLHATVWPSQASIAVDSGELVNNANNLVFKLPLPIIDSASLFFRTAVGSHLGATLHLRDDYDLSIGLGADASRQNIDPVTGDETVDIRMSSAVYLDRGGSLLASLYLSQVARRAVSINVYPGVAHDDFGGWVVFRRDGGFEVGLSHRLALGLGLGMGVGR